MSDFGQAMKKKKIEANAGVRVCVSVCDDDRFYFKHL